MGLAMPSQFDPYHKWLGIPPEEQPPNHYRLLGIKPFEEDPDVIEAAADQRMGHLRTFQSGKHAQLSQRLLNQVAAAKVCLLNPDQKAGYDAMLRHELEDEKREKPAARSAARPDSLTDEPPASELAVPQIDTSIRSRSHRRRSPTWLLPVSAAGLVVGGIVLLVVFLSWRAGDESPRKELAATGGHPQDAGKAEPDRPPHAQGDAGRPFGRPEPSDDRPQEPAGVAGAPS